MWRNPIMYVKGSVTEIKFDFPSECASLAKLKKRYIFQSQENREYDNAVYIPDISMPHFMDKDEAKLFLIKSLKKYGAVKSSEDVVAVKLTMDRPKVKNVVKYNAHIEFGSLRTAHNTRFNHVLRNGWCAKRSYAKVSIFKSSAMQKSQKMNGSPLCVAKYKKIQAIAANPSRPLSLNKHEQLVQKAKVMEVNSISLTPTMENVSCYNSRKIKNLQKMDAID